MDSLNHKGKAPGATSPTSTKGSEDSLPIGAGSNPMIREKGFPYGKIAAGVALLVLLGAVGALVAIFITSDGGNSSDQSNLRSGLLGPGETSAPTASPSPPPTTSPSEIPSATPSALPSIIPTISPSTSPSTQPSAAPSSLPSLRPSSKPSSTPSIQPTKSPTTSPTFHPTATPTRELVPENFYFRLKLYWERWFFWQEEFEERRWCLECTTCEQLTTSGFGEGCSDADRDDRTDCRDGDSLWTQRCDGWEGGEGNAQFELLRTHPEADQLKIRGKDLCLERASNVHLHLQPCDSDSIRQLWLGFRLDGEPFELRPYQQHWRPNQYDLPVETERCISQHHHPKPGEVLYLETCQLASFWNTVLWEMY